MSFMPDASALGHMVATTARFRPHLVLADGLEVSLPARHLAQVTGAPLAYRSQNVEHVYWREQGRLARGKARLPFILGQRGLANAEQELRGAAALVLDIGQEDLDWWTGRAGCGNAVLMPPLWLEAPEEATAPISENRWDISFTGGLYAPNNVDGLRWFVREVLPRLNRKLARQPRIAFAGSSPNEEVLALTALANIECVANPDSLLPIRMSSRMLINPVRHSSGVNIKMIEMLAAGRPIASTSAGVRGLPVTVRTLVSVADDADGFAEATAHALGSRSFDGQAARDALRAYCGLSTLDPLVALARTDV
jgi:hypothetical protein